MLYTFKQHYNEESCHDDPHSFGEALREITKLINRSCASYTIIGVYDTRTTVVGDRGAPYYLDFAEGEVSVLAEIEPIAEAKKDFEEALI